MKKIKITTYFSIPLISSYVFYYIMGYYVLSDSFELTKKKNILLGILSFITLLIGVILSKYDTSVLNLGQNYYTQHGLFSILFASLFISYNIKKIYRNKKISNVRQIIIKQIGSLTFCIYMIHAVFLDNTRVVFDFLCNNMHIPIGFSLLIYQIVLFICLIVAGLIIKVIPGVKKMF